MADVNGVLYGRQSLGQMIPLSRDVHQLVGEMGDAATRLLMLHGVDGGLEEGDAIAVPLARRPLSASVQLPLPGLARLEEILFGRCRRHVSPCCRVKSREASGRGRGIGCGMCVEWRLAGESGRVLLRRGEPRTR